MRSVSDDALTACDRIALGCGSFGGVGSAPGFFGQGLDERQAATLMDAAWELGIRHFDTADAYGGGRSERSIGRWVASTGLRPAITTKVYNPMDEGGDRGLAPERIRRQLEGSLERLGVDSVERYLAHEFDPDTPPADTIAALAQLHHEGRIGGWGYSNVDPAQLRVVLRAGHPIAVQNSYSLLARGDADEVLPLCAENAVEYEAYGPLMGGWLTGKYRRGADYPAGSRMTQRPEPYAELATDRTFDALDGLRALSARRGGTMAGTALAWLLADPRISRVVVGPGSIAHLAPVSEAIARPLTPDERAELEGWFTR